MSFNFPKGQAGTVKKFKNGDQKPRITGDLKSRTRDTRHSADHKLANSELLVGRNTCDTSVRDISQIESKQVISAGVSVKCARVYEFLRGAAQTMAVSTSGCRALVFPSRAAFARPPPSLYR